MFNYLFKGYFSFFFKSVFREYMNIKFRKDRDCEGPKHMPWREKETQTFWREVSGSRRESCSRVAGVFPDFWIQIKCGATAPACSFERRLLDWKGPDLSFVLNPSIRLENRFLVITKVLFSPEIMHVFPDSLGQTFSLSLFIFLLISSC